MIKDVEEDLRKMVITGSRLTLNTFFGEFSHKDYIVRERERERERERAYE